MYGCQQVLLNPDQELVAVLEFICSEANKLMNCGIYYARQVWFKRRRIIGKYDLEKEYKNNKHFQALYSQAAQEVLRTVRESFKSFDGLMKALRKGKITDNPRLLTAPSRVFLWNSLKIKGRDAAFSPSRSILLESPAF